MVCEVCLCPRQRHENKDFVPRVREGEGSHKGSHRLPKQGLDGAPQICGRGGTCAEEARLPGQLALSRVEGAQSKQKTAPVFGGGQVALVLSCCESFFGGQTAGEPSARLRSLRGWLCGLRRSAPNVDYMPWGDVESWAAKLFSINRMCTLPALIRAGFALGSAPAVSIGALPSATKCMR